MNEIVTFLQVLGAAGLTVAVALVIYRWARPTLNLDASVSMDFEEDEN